MREENPEKFYNQVNAVNFLNLLRYAKANDTMFFLELLVMTGCLPQILYS